MTHQTERDLFAARLLEWSNRTGLITSNGNSVGRAETSSDKQAGWSGQAAGIRVQGNQSESGQPEKNHRVEERGRGNNQETQTRVETLRCDSRGKSRLRNECVEVCMLICVCVNEVQVWQDNQAQVWG